MDTSETAMARQDICEGKARYCRTLDTKDWAGFADLFTEDFVLDVSEAFYHRLWPLPRALGEARRHMEDRLPEA